MTIITDGRRYSWWPDRRLLAADKLATSLLLEVSELQQANESLKKQRTEQDEQACTLQGLNALLKRQRAEQEEHFKAELTKSKLAQESQKTELQQLRHQKDVAEARLHAALAENQEVLEQAKKMLLQQQEGLSQQHSQNESEMTELQQRVIALSQVNEELLTERVNAHRKSHGLGCGLCMVRQIMALWVKGDVGMRVVMWREAVQQSAVDCAETDTVMEKTVELAELSLKVELLKQQKADAEALAERLVESSDGLVGIKDEELETVRHQLCVAEQSSSDMAQKARGLEMSADSLEEALREMSLKAEALQQNAASLQTQLQWQQQSFEATIAKCGESATQVRELIEALKERSNHAEELKGSLGMLEEKVQSLEELIENLQQQSAEAAESAERLRELLEEKEETCAEQERLGKDVLHMVEEKETARLAQEQLTKAAECMVEKKEAARLEQDAKWMSYRAVAMRRVLSRWQQNGILDGIAEWRRAVQEAKCASHKVELHDMRSKLTKAAEYMVEEKETARLEQEQLTKAAETMLEEKETARLEQEQLTKAAECMVEEKETARLKQEQLTKAAECMVEEKEAARLEQEQLMEQMHATMCAAKKEAKKARRSSVGSSPGTPTSSILLTPQKTPFGFGSATKR